MPKLSIQDLDVRGQRVLVRVDFNVPLGADGQITDDSRIRAALPTLDYLLERGARVILCSHLGRPKGGPDPSMSLRPVAQNLTELIHRPVAFVDDCIGEKVEKTVAILQNGDCLLLENLRFHPEEEANDPVFAKKLAAYADLYVNDAFGSAHRAHASTEGVTRFIKQSAAGFLMEKELKYLGEELDRPERPFVAILGGAKVSDKISVIESLLDKADRLLVGGAMAYTFLKSQGIRTGGSLVENDRLDVSKRILDLAEKKGRRFLLPADHVVARRVETDRLDKKGRKIVEFQDAKPSADASIEEGWCGVDIGPRTLADYQSALADARTVFWNGPMGIFENKNFAKGTYEIARAVAGRGGVKSIVGGGDSVKAIHSSGLADKITFLSTGGGASLEFLEGKTLPGVAALTDK
ncbi:MAG: phosphoglycerate kinase [Verrucomicrobia bacterium]|nr:phosphoglycerate kinase [Verrucomicrobiota bacterium]